MTREVRVDAYRAGDAVTAAVTLVTAGFGVVAAVRPKALTGEEPTPGQLYYAQMYSARALPLAAALLVTQHQGRLDRPLLWAAAAAQLGDVAIGVRRRAPEQVFPPLAGAALYAWRALRG